MKIKLKLSAEELRKKLNLKDGEDGYSPIKGVDYFDGEKGKDAELIDMENLMNEIDKKLELIKIELKEELKKEIQPSRTVVLGGRKDRFISEEPTGTVDGVNDTFYLSATPRENSLILMWQGQGQRPTATTEYTLTGKKITFNANSIPTGGALWVFYTKF